jgi:hypothetical protein
MRKTGPRKVLCASGNTVEKWYDRRGRNFVVQVNDPQGNQIGDADYSGTKESRDFAFQSIIKQEGGKKY